MIQSVVFDFGQVLASPANLFTEPASRLRIDPADFEAAYWQGRREYDAGGTAYTYWTQLLTTLGLPNHPETIHMLTGLDAELWAPMRPSAWQLLKDVKATGTTVAIVSNAPSALDWAFADQPYATDADYWFVSASMGICKPNPEVYARVHEVLGGPANSIAFIDDRIENVDAAREAGWQAHLFVDDDDSRAWLTSLGVLA